MATVAEDARLLTRPVPWLIGERHTLAAHLGPLVTRALARPVRPQPPTELQLQILDGRERLAHLGFHRGLPLPPLLRK